MSFPAIINLASLDPDTGFRINGITDTNFAGWALAGLGDFNHDGIADFVVSARGASGAGAAYVIFGDSNGFPAGVDLAALDGTDGFAITGSGGTFFGWDVALAGDVNGDGDPDLLVSAPGGSPNGSFSGNAYVIYGGAGPFLPSLSITALDGSNGFRMNGSEASSFGGWAISAGGDFNGDGYDDVVVTAYAADSNGANAGSVWVVYGSDGGPPASIDLGSLNGVNGFRIIGPGVSADLGSDVAGGADINHDGYDDLIIGARGTSEAYVLYGRAGAPATLNASSVNGTTGFVMTGTAGTRMGGAVSFAGDINGDGFEDMLVGAYADDTNGSNAGQTFVIFGKASGIPASFSTADLNGTNGFRILGIATNDQSGQSVSAAGDVNGDGFGDLLISARRSSVGASMSGAAYVLFGKAGGFTASFNLASIDGTNGFRILGAAANDQTGVAVAAAGDINGDGVDDILVGAPYADPNGNNSGAAYVIYGQADVRNFFGTGFADTFSGGLLADTILGAGGKDVLHGRGGGDEILGGDGNDMLYGDAGDDSVSGGLGNDLLDGGDGNDTLFDSAGSNKLYGGNGDDAMTGGAGNDQIDGGADNDTLVGGGGNDTLDGGTGTNTLFGGAGNDVYYVRTAGDSTAEAAGQGSDTVRAFLSFVLADNFETLELQGSGDLNGTGNSAGNTVKGNDGANLLMGLDGADKLFGGLGADTLIGGLGRDQMTGGGGADSFRVLQESIGQAVLEIDTILDYQTGVDRLDLSAIDANSALANDQAFQISFTGLTRTAGQAYVFYTAASNTSTLRLDVNGDGKADYQLTINGDVRADTGDWLL